MSETARNQVPGAVRALDLLESLAGAPDGLTSAEMSEVVSGSRSSLYTLINTLRDRGYIIQDDTRGRYRIGPATWGLVPDQTDATATLVEAFNHLHDSEQPSETMALVSRTGDTFLVVAEAATDRTVRAVYTSGSPQPPNGAAALVLRAGSAGDDNALQRVRSDGHALVESRDLVEIAVPVCADGIQPVTALTVGIPTQRADDATRERFISQLRSDAIRLSHRLGARIYTPYGVTSQDPVGPRRTLADSEVSELLDGVWGIQLACIRNDGSPHLVPLWYEWDGASLWITATPGASWKDYVAVNDMVSLTLDEPWPPLRRVFVRGRAVPVDDEQVPGGVAGLRRRLATRYLGNRSGDHPEWSETTGWRVYRIDPTHISGVEGLAS